MTSRSFETRKGQGAQACYTRHRQRVRNIMNHVQLRDQIRQAGIEARSIVAAAKEQRRGLNETEAKRIDALTEVISQAVVIVEAVRTPIGRGHPEKGYYKDTHPNELLGDGLHRGDRARRDRARRRRGRDRRLRPAVRRADVQRHAQRVAAGRAAGRDAGDDRRPPVRLRPAGRQLRRGADRRGRPRRRDRRRRRAHGPHPDGRRLQVGRRGRLAVPAGAARALRARARRGSRRR